MVTITRKELNINNRGFTFVEIMIVVIIIGIISAAAYPSYQRYVTQGKRADMMAELQQIASRIESQKISYKTYDKIPLNKIYGQSTTNGSIDFPYNGAALYTVSIFNDSGNKITGDTLGQGSSKWKLEATPKSTAMMSSDGTLTLDYTGQKCRGTDCGMGNQWKDK